MALTAAELVAYLRMDKSGFDRDLSGAERQMGRSQGKFREWSKGMGRAAVETATAGAAATAGLATAVFLTGANYNTLQQQSRAALTTIMGSAEEANAQMDKLDEFATTSPFAKDVFIKAQQQLLGFGMEAENVVPTLGAIQDAVAAVGGSNEDIAGIANVLAKVEGTGKITAQTFNELGIRGIDAATIIGEEMGKTGNEIRDSVTKGTLDADKAMEALTTGMTKRFGGAAENVKNTMVGALDRVKAATRDIGAELARPFVDPKGGGKAVDWANEFADVLRAVQRQTVPFVELMMRRFEPAMYGVSASLKDAKDAVDRFDMSDLDAALDKMSGYAPAIAGVSGALLTMGSANIPVIGRLASALGPIPAALTAAALASPEMRDALGDLWDTAQPLVGTLGDVAVVAAGAFSEGVGIAASALQIGLDVIGPLVEGFDSLPGPVKTATGLLVAFAATRKLMPTFSGQMDQGFSAIQTGVKNAMNAFQPWGGRFEGAAADALSFRSKLNIVTSDLGRSAAQGFRGAVNGVMGLFGGPWGLALAGATVAIGFWAQEQQKAKERAAELKATLDEQTGAFTENSNEVILSQLENEKWGVGQVSVIESADALGISLQDLVGYIKGEREATENVNSALDEYDEKQGMVVDAHGRGQVASQEFRDSIAGVKNETSETVEEEKRRLDQLQELEDSTDDAKRAQQQYAEAIEVASDETRTMEERTRGLKDALDILRGAEKSAEQATRDLYDSNQSLSEFIQQVAEESDGLATGLWDVEEGMATVSTEGNRLNEMLERHKGDMIAAALAAYDKAGGDENAAEAAKAAADAYSAQVDELERVAIEADWSEEEVAAMIETMKRTPAEIEFAISSNTPEAELEVLQLTNTIDELPDGDTYITDNNTSQEVIDILKDLGYDVRNLDDGTVEVTASGVNATIEEIREAARGPYKATIEVDVKNPRSVLQSMVGGQQRRHPNIERPRYHGGIDVIGMADGGITPQSVMDVAQMVAPGDIRFAGDRSDVDEAWIPLDGSARSIAILQEAMARMPNFEPAGMAAGGIDGTLTPPQVEGVDAPDTSVLEQVWQDTMAVLEESTRDTFGAIESDTAASQNATTAHTRAQLVAMQDATTTHLGGMQSVTAAQFALMAQLTAQNMSAMESDTRASTTGMRSTADAEFTAMQLTGSQQTSMLRDTAAAHFRSLHTEAAFQASGLRADSNREFTSMQLHGVEAARVLRAGVISEMSETRSPFTSRVNDLVEVMRSFSAALNKAYGDMGVKVGSPVRLASGGIMPGYTPGRDVHSFSSPTGGRLELSGGEAVMRPEFTRAVGPAWVHSMNALARAGGSSAVRDAIKGPVQAFADGGIIGEFSADAKRIGADHKAKLPGNWLDSVGAHTIDEVIKGIESHMESMMGGDGWVRPTSGRITSPYGAGRGKYPHAGIDIAGGHGRVVAATAGIVRDAGWNIGPGRTGIGSLIEHLGGLWTYYGHSPVGGLRVKKGDMVTAGQHVQEQGNTGNSTGRHLHWEVHKGNAWNDVNPMPWWNAAGGGGAAGSGSGGSDRWAGVIRQALRLNSLPTSERYVNAWLRQVQTESGGNPSAVQGIRDINSIMGNHARGLLQVIPPTFAAYSLPGMGNIMNPLHNAAAGMNYAKNRYGVLGMLSAIGQGRGYKNGTRHALDGWHMVGELGPELVNFQGGETVLNAHQTRREVAGSKDSMSRAEARLVARELAKAIGPTTHIENLNARDDDDVMRKLDERDKRNRLVRQLL